MSATSEFEARYLSGRELYGDDFTGAELEAWFDDEREGYADLGAGSDDTGHYGYHALNRINAFSRLPAGRRFGSALGVGSAYAREFEPIESRIDALTVLEPSDQLVGHRLPGGLAPTYVKPEPSGLMPFDDGAFDLVVCLGVLHHVPNVSTVVHEIGRVTEPGGYAILREPIHSMGDWRYQRKPGITKRERGIPRRLFESMVRDSGLTIVSSRLCVFSLSTRLGRLVDPVVPGTFNSTLFTHLDRALSVASAPLYRYHARNKVEQVRPTAVFVVARKS